jgi:hypothetical protein
MKRVVALVLGVLFLCGGAIAQNKGALVIQCNVTGAQVLINGKLYGNTTPNYSMLVPAGTYKITVKKNGYVDYTNTVAVTAAGVVLQVNLKSVNEAPPPPQVLNYGLTVSANINGADVFINGNPAGKTPFAAQVPNGSYTVLVRAGGFIDFTQNIVINGGPFQVNAMLQGQNQQLSIQANVNGADIFINGNVAGKTPFVSQVPMGSYSVLIKAPGYVDFGQNILVGNGPVQVNATLQALSYQLNVNANVDGALVFINGAQVGQTPYISLLPQGNYVVLIRAAGFIDYQAQLTVNGPQAINASLQPMPASWQLRLPEGLVNKDIKKGQARGIQVWVDGVLQAESLGPIFAAGQLQPGKHLFRIVSGGLAVETQVEMQSGKAYSIEPAMGIMVK